MATTQNPTQLCYGNIIYLKVMNQARLWLTGGRGNGNESVVTRDGENEGTLEPYYQWSVRQSHDDSQPGTRGINYGDYVYLKVVGIDNRWLNGGRSNGNETVLTRDGEGWTNSLMYQWRIMRDHATVGSGPVYIDDEVYLQLRNDNTLFLSGGRSDGDHEQVVTRNGEGWSPSSLVDSYRWAIGLTGSAALKPYNIQVKAVTTAFANVNDNGNKRDGSGTFTTLADYHIQGMASCGGYYIMSHSDQPNTQGVLLIFNTGQNNLVNKIRTPSGHGCHPGGIQAVGEYLVVGVENDDATDSWVHFYDCTKLTNNSGPVLLSTSIHRQGVGAGAVGMTNYIDSDGNNRYFLAVFSHGQVDFYRSNAKPLGDPQLIFNVCGSDSISGFECMCLVAQKQDPNTTLVESQTQEIYALGFISDKTNSGTSYVDTVELVRVENAIDGAAAIKFSTSTSSPAPSTRHMTCASGFYSGLDGVHFRFGAGLYIRSQAEIEFFATQRTLINPFNFDVFTL